MMSVLCEIVVRLYHLIRNLQVFHLVYRCSNYSCWGMSSFILRIIVDFVNRE